MDLDLNAAELSVLQSVRGLLDLHQPAVFGYGKPGLDAPLLAALADGGLLSLAAQGPQGRVQAMLLIHEVSRANAVISIGTQAMLGPVVAAADPRRPIALKRAGEAVPVRFAAQAELLLVLGAAQAEMFELAPADITPVRSHYVYPFARVELALPRAPIATFPAELIVRRWQLGLAGEVTGALSGALAYLVKYLSQREQFDRKLGAFQALQHRLSELAVTLEAARHLALEAAWSDSTEAAAMAAFYAADAARKMCLEAHQLSGAQGFTLEAGLHAWTLRLHALSLEAGGARWHAGIAAEHLWPSADGHKPVVETHNGSYKDACKIALA